MGAAGASLLLWWLSCCGSGSAVWRYFTSIPTYRIFSTRSTITLHFEGSSFQSWKIPDTCTIENAGFAVTDLRCSSAGMQPIKPIVRSGQAEEEERYLALDTSHICFMWYYIIKNDFENLTQIFTVWVYDPENADYDELTLTAKGPSINSQILSKQLATLGQKPSIHTVLKKKSYFPGDITKKGTWDIHVPMSAVDILKEIRGNEVAFQDCFIAHIPVLVPLPLFSFVEDSSFLPLTSPAGSQLMCSWIACIPSYSVLVSDTETFQTNDSYTKWTKVRVPPNVLSSADRHNVTGVSMLRDGIVFVISGALYLKDAKEFLKLGRGRGVPESGIIGTVTRRWCWIKYLLKSERRKSVLMIWTSDEAYLGYASYHFSKLTDTVKLKKILNLPPSDTLTIQSVEYTAHPLEIALLLNHCVTCTTDKQVYLIIFHEDLLEWAFQDFKLDIPMDSGLSIRFLYSATPDFILWDKHRLYYSYQNFTKVGIMKTQTASNNLSELSNGSNIHIVISDYFGTILAKMDNNIMFYTKIHVEDMVKLHLWMNYDSKSVFLFSLTSQLFIIKVLGNDLLKSEEYPLTLEVQSITHKLLDKCPYLAFHNNIYSIFYFLDKGENLSAWAQIVYPENLGLSIIVEFYGPKILHWMGNTEYEIALGFCTKSLKMTFYQNTNYESVDDYFDLQEKNTGLVLVQLRPSEYSKTCPTAQRVFQVAIGCDTNKYIQVKGFDSYLCQHRDFSYVIDRSYLRHHPSKNMKVRYDWGKFGCPLRLDFRKHFQPMVQLFDENGFVKDVRENLIVWEIHGREDYSYNITMKQAGCLNKAQTWKTMIEQNPDLPLEDVWGPQNYKTCFSFAVGVPGDLNQPYEIINLTNNNYLFWPMDHAGMYVFKVKILDPNFSFCNLTAIFAIETFGVIPRPDIYLVAAFLFVLVLLVLSILVLSYFWYMKIYREFIFEPLYKPPVKQKKN